MIEAARLDRRADIVEQGAGDALGMSVIAAAW